MSKHRGRAEVTPETPPSPPQPEPAALALLVALAAASALWSLFLWAELLVARAGAEPFCPLSDPTACSTLWDGPFASAVHHLSGLPIAGWGLVWSLAAFALALAALTRRALGATLSALITSLRLVAAAGLAAVFVFVAVSVGERAFCPGCLVSYVLAGGFAGVALFTWQPLGLPERARGAGLALGALAAAFLALVYPGLHTPHAGEAGGLSLPQTPVTAAPPDTPVSGATDPARAANDAELARLVSSLEGGQRQALANALEAYRRGLDLGRPPVRFVVGPESASVRITDFTDIRCEHCAQLFEALERERAERPQAFSLEPRQFPLDGECNPYVHQRTDPVRCLAAKAQICMEERPGFFDYAGALFQRQKTLTTEQVLSLGAAYLPRRDLEACIASPATAQKLADDIQLAARYEPDGTPIVLINGKLSPGTPAFLRVILLAGGAADHPAFATLPPGRSVPDSH